MIGLRFASAALIVTLAAFAPDVRACVPRSSMEGGDAAAAAAAARARLAADPADARAACALGDALVGLAAPALARAAYADAIANGAGLAGEVALARAQLRAGERAAGLAVLRRSLDANRDASGLDSAALLALGAAARELAREDPALVRLALDLHEAAMARDPGNLAARVGLGDLLLDRYNNEEALDVYRGALAIDETYVPAMLGIARSAHFDHSPAALEAVDRALETDPDFAAARVFRARLLLEADEPVEAEREVSRALALRPGSVAALGVLAAIRYVQGEPDDFASALERVEALAPGDSSPFVTLAEIAAQSRRYAEAARFAERAVRIDPSDWRAHGLVGVNLLRDGRIALGRESLETAFRGDPFNVWFKNTLDLVDSWRDYETARSARFELVAPRRELALLGPHLLPLAEAAYDYYSERYDYRPRTPIRIEVYPRHEDLSVRTVGLVGVDILGVSFGPVIAMDSPAARKGSSFNWASTLWHELAHTFHLGMSANRSARWFSEGLAVHEEHRARAGWGLDVEPGFLRAYVEGRLPRASDLDRAFVRPDYPEQIGHAYLQASMVIALIEREFGAEALNAMLEAYGEGETTESAVERVLKITTAALDARFDAWLRERYGATLVALAPVDGEPAGEYARRWRIGHAAMREGDLGTAERELWRARMLFPAHEGANSPAHHLAELYIELGEKRHAARMLERIVAVDADALDLHVKLARLHIELGNPLGARDALEAALAIEPFDAALHRQLAELYEADGDHERAVRERRAVVDLDPVDMVEARFRLARALTTADRLEEARRETLRTLETAPLFAEGLELLLEVRERMHAGEETAPDVRIESGGSG